MRAGLGGESVAGVGAGRVGRHGQLVGHLVLVRDLQAHGFEGTLDGVRRDLCIKACMQCISWIESRHYATPVPRSNEHVRTVCPRQTWRQGADASNAHAESVPLGQGRTGRFAALRLSAMFSRTVSESMRTPCWKSMPHRSDSSTDVSHSTVASTPRA